MQVKEVDAMKQNRLSGEQVLEKLYGKPGQDRINNLKVFSDRLANQLVNGIGATYGSDTLDLKVRSAITVAAHIILGDLVGIKVHYGNAMNAGLTVEQLKQIILHTFLYAGTTRTIRAYHDLKELLLSLEQLTKKG